MSRNHIHLAQGVPGSGVISGILPGGLSYCGNMLIMPPGMRKSSEILIYIDVQKAIDAGLKFYLSANGVVLSEGDDRGYIKPEFFSRVETVKGVPLPGYDGPQGVTPKAAASTNVSVAAAAEVAEDQGQSASRPTDPSKRDVQVSVQEIERKLETVNL